MLKKLVILVVTGLLLTGVETTVATAGETPTTDIATIEKVFEHFNAGNFSRPTNIDNEWMPLKPGMHWVYEGTTIEEGKARPHRFEFTVTDLTKEVAGVKTVVAYAVDYVDNEVAEKEIAFYAQDNDGNVWYLGEYPEEYKDGKFFDAPTWLSGFEDAKPGLQMRAKPQLGTPPYFQGWGPMVKWSDFAQIHKMGEKECVPVDCFTDVLVIAESSLEEVGAYQYKYFARGVGNIRVGWTGDDGTKEELVMVKFTQLDLQALAGIRTAALALERHAYEISPDMYAFSEPLSGNKIHKLVRKPVSPNSKPKPKAVSTNSPVKVISEADAAKIALKAVPGKMVETKIEKKLGAKRYVVEVIAKSDGAETDVIIEMETGKVLAVEK